MKLQEMANYQKRDTGLNMNIWIDKQVSYKKSGHFKRMKIQLNHGNIVQKENFASVSLFDSKLVNKEKTLKQKNCELTTLDVREAENFATNNNFGLCCIADCLLTESEFLQNIIKGGDLKLSEEIKLVENKIKRLLLSNLNKGYYDSVQTEIVENILG